MGSVFFLGFAGFVKMGGSSSSETELNLSNFCGRALFSSTSMIISVAEERTLHLQELDQVARPSNWSESGGTASDAGAAVSMKSGGLPGEVEELSSFQTDSREVRQVQPEGKEEVTSLGLDLELFLLLLFLDFLGGSGGK